MTYGTCVRVKADPTEVFVIKRIQFDSYGRETTIKSHTGRSMPLVVWYSADELEVVEG